MPLRTGNRYRSLRTLLGSIRMGTIACLALSLGVQNVRADPAPGPTTVIDLTGGRSNSRHVARTLRRQLGGPVSLEPPARRLVEAYRWSRGDPEQSQCEALRAQVLDDIAQKHWVIAPLGQASLFDPLVSQAEEQLAFLDLQGVLETANRLRAWAVCEHAVVAHDLVVRLRLAEALAHVYQNDGQGVSAFVQLLAVEPRFHPSGETGTPQVLAVFADALTTFEHITPVPLERPPMCSVVADGRKLGRMILYPGLHLIQLKAPHGEVRTRWVEIENTSSGHAVDVTKDFDLLSLEQAYRALVRDVSSGSLGTRAATVLDDYLAHRGQGTLMFLVPASSGGPPVLIRYAFRSGIQIWEPDESSSNVTVVEQGGGGTKPGQHRWWLAGGAGIQGLAGGNAFVATGWTGGYTATLSRDGPLVDIRISGGVYPHLLTSAPRERGCSPGDGVDELDVVAAASCLEQRPVWGVSLEVAHGWNLLGGRQIRLSPGVGIDVLKVPNVVVEGAESGWPLVGDALMAGGTVRVRLSYAFSVARRTPELSISGAFGIVAADASDTTVLGTLLGATAQAAIPF